jgi:hypothetical protein
MSYIDMALSLNVNRLKSWGCAMGEFWTKLVNLLFAGFSKNAFYRSLLFGIFFSIVMTLIIGSIEKVFSISKDFPYIGVDTQKYWVGIVFVSLSLLFTIPGYMSEINTRDDFLTPLRKNLVGFWQVRTQSWRIEKEEIDFGWVVSHCTIGIEQLSGKLIIHFDISDSDLFKNQSIDITATTFSFDGPTRKLIYFYEAEFELLNPIGEGGDQITKVDFPFLGVLKMVIDNEKVDFMEGHWYDINNGVYFLARRMKQLAGLDQLRTAVENGAVTFGGALEFKRLKSLPGMPAHSE